MSLKIYVKKKAFDESSQHPKTHKRMGWLRGRTIELWEKQG